MIHVVACFESVECVKRKGENMLKKEFVFEESRTKCEYAGAKALLPSCVIFELFSFLFTYFCHVLQILVVFALLT